MFLSKKVMPKSMGLISNVTLLLVVRYTRWASKHLDYLPIKMDHSTEFFDIDWVNSMQMKWPVLLFG